jgi:hypothetical protein
LAGKNRLDIGIEIIHPGPGHRRKRRLAGRPRKSGCLKVVEQDREHRGALGEVEPLDIIGPLGIVRLRHKTPISVARHDVLEDRAALDQHAIAIAQHRRLGKGMKCLHFRGCPLGLGIAFEGLDLIVVAQFFE